MTKDQIAEACAKAGFPQPEFGRKYATIKVMIGPAVGRLPRATLQSLGELPDVNSRQFDRWCGPVDHEPAPLASSTSSSARPMP